MPRDTGDAAVPVVIGIDVDWAPDPVLEDTLALIEAGGGRATIFATHVTPVLEGLDPDRFEIALHPNLNPVLAGAVQRAATDVVDELHDAFPGAVGLRAHSTVDFPVLREHFARRGGQYESNLLLPAPVEPFYDYSGLVRVPYGWADNVHMLRGEAFTLDALAARLAGHAVWNIGFHPSHVFLDTEGTERFQAARPDLQDAAALVRHRNADPQVPGARSILTAVLEAARAGGQPVLTMATWAAQWRERLGPCPYRHPDSMKDASAPQPIQGVTR